jgi:cytochrome c-type biogenesis protein CcmF
MQDLGQLLLLVTFFTTLATCLTAASGALTKNATLMRAARYGVFAVAGLNVAMAIVLSHSFLTHDFSNKYVTAYSDRSMPTIYLLASFWGGEKGALLFWTTSLSIFSGIAIHTRRHREPVYLSWVVAVLMGALFFFFILMVFESSPFESFAAMAPPPDGNGLNPQLQNPTMAFHPPALLTGYITFTIPFAFAVAALITGKLDVQWITDTRTWTIVSWCFLSIGLILGMLWAYEELGWGFYWMWDPVENAGVIPWFTGTAFLHSVMVQERRGMLKRWNVVLVCMTFLLTIGGTFLTRSQLIDSIHAFANSTLANYFLAYMVVILVLSTALIAWRWKELRAEANIESIYSRESMFVLNNVFLVGCAFIVTWGTIFPKISELSAVQSFYNGVADLWNSSLGTLLGAVEPLDQALTLGEVWFNAVIAPIGLFLLFIMGIGPLIPWRVSSLRDYRRQLFAPLTLGLVITTVGCGYVALGRIEDIAARFELSWLDALDNYAATLGLVDAYVFLAYTFCIYVTWTMLREFHEGTRVRQSKSGDGYIPSLIALVFKVPRRYGGYVIHIGVVLMFVAFTGKAFKFQEPERPLSPGDEVAAQDYRITYTGSTFGWQPDDGYAANRAYLTVMNADEAAAEREVDELAAWLQEREVGAFHVETALGSAKMVVRFKDKEARDVLRDDLYLAHEFTRDFVRVSDDPIQLKQVWRIREQGVLEVVPMIAMQRIRRAKAMLGPGTTINAIVGARGGSADLAVSFEDEEELAAFDTRLAGLNVPDTLLFGGYNPNSGALEFVDNRTGQVLTPEVRFYAKHDTPTTETSISSTLVEDLYLAMRPAMGQNFINLLTVVFPLVTFLWAGSIVLLLGTLLCLTPRWVSRTVIRMTRRKVPRPRAAAAASATATLLLALLALWSPIAEATPLPQPSGMEAPGPAGPLADVQEALTCGCPVTDGVERTLADSGCACLSADEDRQLVSQLFGEQPRMHWATGRAKLEVLGRLTKLDPAYDSRLRYSRTEYQRLLTTTKTTCPGERGLVLSQSQLSCSVRNLWLPRFRHMLAAGMTVERIHTFFVDENNVTMAPSVPWSYADLKAHADKALSWALPGAVLAAFLAGLLVFAVRRTRRNRVTAESEPEVIVPVLSERERLLLEDELDLLDA